MTTVVTKASQYILLDIAFVLVRTTTMSIYNGVNKQLSHISNTDIKNDLEKQGIIDKVKCIEMHLNDLKQNYEFLFSKNSFNIQIKLLNIKLKAVNNVILDLEKEIYKEPPKFNFFKKDNFNLSKFMDILLIESNTQEDFFYSKFIIFCNHLLICDISKKNTELKNCKNDILYDKNNAVFVEINKGILNNTDDDSDLCFEE